MVRVGEDHRNLKLKEVFPRIDNAVQTLLRLKEPVAREAVLPVWREAQWLQERIHHYDLAQCHPQVHEVVSFLSLSCFSLLYLEGESFSTYREELRSRYKSLLRWVYFSPKFATVGSVKRMSHSIS
ncbi:hypothetical protein [Desmospora activa]|uniref:Uncharacterized protein n=1 Tax=Desmospora activa DSM 45169 TaxID=1121389 RepID=A0A2T4Z981_9BACL|nr:hypothetical protein [Desmospora activa]PTM58451.1 hypothetical protein C8J48_1034 [Desmospora activa DSM 45169]